MYYWTGKLEDLCEASSPFLTLFYSLLQTFTTISEKSIASKLMIDIICQFGSNRPGSGLKTRVKIFLQHTCGPQLSRSMVLRDDTRYRQLG